MKMNVNCAIEAFHGAFLRRSEPNARSADSLQ
jgi:hypothetical protein